ncbi:MAG: glycosyltransferase family 2 protein [Flavobacterium sp.]|nr:glycosyltransferase family 2 protein [Flavobacterium sp.]
MKTKITVVVVTFNGSKWLHKMLESVLKSSISVNVIIVDNASTDNSGAIIETYTQVQLIKSNINLGFGKANNIGIKAALQLQSDYIFLLNQDTWVFETTIQTLVKTAQLNPELGIISPVHLTANEKDLDQNFETYFSKKINNNSTDYDEVTFVNAAAWLVSKACFDKVGLFEPLFNHYGEDRNFCDRVIFHGFKISIEPDAFIVHDRLITRSFNKDVLQSKYKILNVLLNVNYTFAKSLLIALKNVFGLPKFFRSFYSSLKTATFFIKLLFFYFKNILHFNKILAIRNRSKNGLNGL